MRVVRSLVKPYKNFLGGESRRIIVQLQAALQVMIGNSDGNITADDAETVSP